MLRDLERSREILRDAEGNCKMLRDTEGSRETKKKMLRDVKGYREIRRLKDAKVAEILRTWLQSHLSEFLIKFKIIQGKLAMIKCSV